MTVTARPRSSRSASDPQAASSAATLTEIATARIQRLPFRSARIEHIDLRHERKTGAMDERGVDNIGADRLGLFSQLEIVHLRNLLLAVKDIDADLAYQEAIGDRLSHIATARWWLVDDADIGKLRRQAAIERRGSASSHGQTGRERHTHTGTRPQHR